MIHVSLIEDDTRTRVAMEAIFNGTEGFRCVSSHGSTEDALKHLPLDRTDVALVDLTLPGMSGIELIRVLKQRRATVLCCVLTLHEDGERVFESLKAGASGYLLKKTPPSRLLEMLVEMVGGGAPMSPTIARKIAEYFHRQTAAKVKLESLTTRESEILHQIAQGLADKRIADKLEISANTVRNHVANIYQKLHVHSRVEASEKYRQG